jgi:hypothetical protein
MPGALGKRKSRAVEEEPEAQVDAQELLRRHFEARFKPLAASPAAAPRAARRRAANGHPDSNTDGSDDSAYSQDGDDSDAEAGQSDPEWGGVSDDEGMRTGPFLLLGDRTTAETDQMQRKKKNRMLSRSLTTHRPPQKIQSPK